MARMKIDLPSRVLFSCTLPVRITDVNYDGHVGNDSLLSLLHEARLQFLRSMGYSEKDVEGKGIIMTDAVLVYKAEVFYGETLAVEVGVADVQRHGLDIVYRVTSNGKETARAKTGIAFFDYEKRSITSMPEEFRSRIASAEK
jgi:acyl-CoA thioesterase FadM